MALEDVTTSEKMIKIRSLLKEGINIDNNVKDTVDSNENIEHLFQDIGFMNCSTENVAISEDSREVSCLIAGYIGTKQRN